MGSFDQELLKELEKDSRVRLRVLAKRLNTSITTVHNHLKSLREDGTIKRFSVALDDEALGYKLKAVIGVNISKGQLTEVESVLARFKEVLCVYDVTGSFDAFLVTRFRDIKGLNNFVKKVQKLDFIDRTETFVVLETKKEDFRVFV
jgi:DNA-binding Lrp family transcriptional regulator